MARNIVTVKGLARGSVSVFIDEGDVFTFCLSDIDKYEEQYGWLTRAQARKFFARGLALLDRTEPKKAKCEN